MFECKALKVYGKTYCEDCSGCMSNINGWETDSLDYDCPYRGAVSDAEKKELIADLKWLSYM